MRAKPIKPMPSPTPSFPIPNSPRRYLVLVAAVMMQACLGATYSWSVFVRALRETGGMTQAATQVPFSVFYLVFPVTVLIGGMLLARLGPRACCMCSGFLFGAGWVMAGFGKWHFAYTIVGIGVLGGMGVGIGYLAPIATCIRWFPAQKGLVTGISVAGFGGGAAVISRLAGYLLLERGLSPFQTFQLLGVPFCLMVTLAAVFIRNPPASGEAKRAPPRLGFRGMIGDPGFILLYGAMFCGLAAGFSINGNLKDLSPVASEKAGILAVTLFALTNALGRIVWGWIYDRVSSAPTLAANLVLQAALLSAAPQLLKSENGLYALALGTGLCYGGVLVLYASSVAERWGVDRVGAVYGWLFTANIPASIAPILAALAFDRYKSFLFPLLGLAMLLYAATAVVLWNRARIARRPPDVSGSPAA